MELADLDAAKAKLSAYLQSKDSDLNQEQADILAGAAIKFAQEAGRVLTHKFSKKGFDWAREKVSAPSGQGSAGGKEPMNGGEKRNKIKNEGVNPYIGKSKQELLKSKAAYEKLVEEHEHKMEVFKKDPLGNTAPEKLKQMTADRPTVDVLFERARQRITALEKQLNKQRSELHKINEALDSNL